MKCKKTQILVFLAVAALASALLYFEGAGAKKLTDRQMSRILGKAEECYCSQTNACGPDCQGDGRTCTNCDGSSCSIAKEAGTRPTCCQGKQSTNPKSCDDNGQLTCITTITCKTDNFDNKTCGDGICSGPIDEICPLCSNGTSNPDKLTSYVCQASST